MNATAIQQTLLPQRKPFELPIPLQLGISTLGVVLVTVAMLAIEPHIHPPTPSLLYILVVLISAINFGIWSGLATSILTFLAFNFYFVLPHHALGVTSLEDAIRLVVFLSVALLASGLAGRVHKHSLIAAQRASELAALYSLSQTISAEVEMDRILPIIAQTTIQILPVPACQICLYDGTGKLIERASAGNPIPGAAQVAIDLLHPREAFGVLRVTLPPDRHTLTAAEEAILQTIALQVVLVLDRAHLVDEASKAQVLADSNRLKSTLLSSVSHDLRTPLAAIKGAVTNLLDTSVGWEVAARQEFLSTIDEETDRLNRLVGDLLEMSRIEVGALQQTLNWHDLGEVIECVVDRLQPHLTQHLIAVRLPNELPPVQISYTQIDHVLTNLLENAARYAPANSTIEVVVTPMEDLIQVEVLDRGPGIPEQMLPHIFEKFVRVIEPERHAEGSGLGLAICKGLIEAHGGQIWAENRGDGGARFVFRLPLKVWHTPAPQQHNVHGE